MINNYNFKIGDEVITTTGKVGKIVYICKCDECKRRGFYEPVWLMDHATVEDYITNIDAELGFPTFYKIGDYHFNDFDKASLYHELGYLKREVDELERRLKFIIKIENEESED